jgi:hypothetical protein
LTRKPKTYIEIESTKIERKLVQKMKMKHSKKKMHMLWVWWDTTHFIALMILHFGLSKLYPCIFLTTRNHSNNNLTSDQVRVDPRVNYLTNWSFHACTCISLFIFNDWNTYCQILITIIWPLRLIFNSLSQMIRFCN